MWQLNGDDDKPKIRLIAEDLNSWRRRRISKLSLASSRLDTSGRVGDDPVAPGELDSRHYPEGLPSPRSGKRLLL